MTAGSAGRHRAAGAKSTSSHRPPVWFIALLIALLPVIAVVNVAVFGSMYLICRGFRIYREIKQAGKERRLRKRLGERGRFLDEKELEAKLRAGEGTLILQYPSRDSLQDYPDAMLWWTSDDIFRLSPVSLPAGSRQLEEETLSRADEQRYKQYVDQFVTRYIDENHGCASLTRFPKQLLDKFPKPKVVTLQQAPGATALFHGYEDRLRAAILNTEDRPKRPYHTKVEVEHGSDGLRLIVPALGMRQFSKEVVACAFGFLSGLLVAAGCGIAAMWFFPFWLGAVVGVLAVALQTVNLLQIISMARRPAKIEVSGETLRLKKSGILPGRWQEWKRSAIAIIGVSEEGSAANGRPIMDWVFGLDDLRSIGFFRARMKELQIHFHDLRTIDLLAGRDPEELEWIGTLLRRQLRLN